MQPVIPAPLEPIYTTRGYSPGVRVGDLLFIAGMLGRDEALNVVADHEARLERMFDNMGLVLAEAGCTFSHVAELTGYFTNLDRDHALFADVRRRYLSEPSPAITVIGVAAPSHPSLICELKGIAVIPATN